jgi:hypothetical protein
VPHGEVFVIAAPDAEARVVAQALDIDLCLYTHDRLLGVAIWNVAAGKWEVLPDEQA